MNFKPLHDRVLVKRVDSDEKTAGGIIIPDTAQEKPMEGEVLEIGSGARDEMGKLVPLDVKKGDKVVVPAVSWSTDLAPVVQLGLTPILCDCNLDNLSIDIEHFKKIIEDESPKVIILVSVLGLVPEMEEIVDLCNCLKFIYAERNNVFNSKNVFVL